MKPTLPNYPTIDVDVISYSWLSKLLDCVKYAMEYPRPDGKTIYLEPSGTIRAAVPQSSPAAPAAVAQSVYLGMFKVVDVPTDDGSAPTQIRIIDGANPDSEFCGETDLFANVRVATIPKKKNVIVYIFVQKSLNTVAFSFGTEKLSNMTGVGFWELARIDGTGNIRQLWVANMLIFRGRFLI